MQLEIAFESKKLAPNKYMTITQKFKHIYYTNLNKQKILENEHYFNVEPLCYLCSLKLDPSVTLSTSLITKFKSMANSQKNFQLKCVEPPVASHLPGGFVKYQVEMFTYVHTAPSFNQILYSLSVSNLDASCMEPETAFEPVLISFFFSRDNSIEHNKKHI